MGNWKNINPQGGSKAIAIMRDSLRRHGYNVGGSPRCAINDCGKCVLYAVEGADGNIYVRLSPSDFPDWIPLTNEFYAPYAHEIRQEAWGEK